MLRWQKQLPWSPRSITGCVTNPAVPCGLTIINGTVPCKQKWCVAGSDWIHLGPFPWETSLKWKTALSLITYFVFRSEVDRLNWGRERVCSTNTECRYLVHNTGEQPKNSTSGHLGSYSEQVMENPALVRVEWRIATSCLIAWVSQCMLFHQVEFRCECVALVCNGTDNT